MLEAIGAAVTRLFDILLAPVGGHPGVALAAASLGCGAGVMALFRATSPQARLRRLRRRFQARILEIRVYQHDPVLVLKALGGALGANLATLRWLLVPLLAAGAVASIVVIQLEARFAHARLRAGEVAVVTAAYRTGVDPTRDAPTLNPGRGASVDLAVRVPARREIAWRVRVTASGAPLLTLGHRGRHYRFALAAAPGIGAVGRARGRSAWGALLQPGMPPLPDDLAIDRVTVGYAGAEHRLLGWRTSWLWVFVFWSLLGAVGFKLVFRGEG